MHKYGDHYVVELVNVNPALADDVEYIKGAMYEQAKQANQTQLTFHWHKFSPQGVSQLLVLQESHIAMHTWPEDGYIQMDVFTCGQHVNQYAQVEFLRNAFRQQFASIKYIPRGKPDVWPKSKNVLQNV